MGESGDERSVPLDQRVVLLDESLGEHLVVGQLASALHLGLRPATHTNSSPPSSPRFKRLQYPRTYLRSAVSSSATRRRSRSPAAASSADRSCHSAAALASASCATTTSTPSAPALDRGAGRGDSRPAAARRRSSSLAAAALEAADRRAAIFRSRVADRSALYPRVGSSWVHYVLERGRGSSVCVPVR